MYLRYDNTDTKLERFLPKNQHTQRKLLNFVFWINGVLSKILIKRDLNIDFTKKCAPKLVFFNEKKMRKIRMIFDTEN